MLTGMPSTKVAKSVPWSRLKPRRKYWFALPSPLCCVTITPGTNSSTSAGRSVGRLSMSVEVTVPALAASVLPTRIEVVALHDHGRERGGRCDGRVRLLSHGRGMEGRQEHQGERRAADADRPHRDVGPHQDVPGT